MNSIMVQYWGTEMFPNFVIEKTTMFPEPNIEFYSIMLDGDYYLESKEDFFMDFPINEKMKKTIDALHENLGTIRAGRANPAILNKINVEYYGVPTPLTQVASVSVPEARMIVIQPWDANILKDIEKEIAKSDIGIMPNNDGKGIRLNFPELTEERRKEIVKTVKKMGEDSKVSIRSIRRDALDFAKNLKKNNEISEDELKGEEDDVQKITDKFVAEIDNIIAAKEKEIMQV